jgi:hypothetical protein
MLTIVALQEEGTCQILQLRRMERRGGAESLCLRVELVLARRACACASGDTVGSGGFFTSSEGFGVRN